MENTAGEESLWLKLLQQSSVRSVLPDATVVTLCADSFIRKHILHILAQDDSSEDEGLGDLELIHSAFLEVEDSAFESPVKVNLWGFDDRILPHTADIIKTSALTHQMGMTIVVDGQKDTEHIINSVLQKLAQAQSLIQTLTQQHLTEERVANMRQAYTSYITSATSLKGDKLSADSNAEDAQLALLSSEGRFESAIRDFPIPVVVVVWEGLSPLQPTLSSPTTADFNSMRTSKELQGRLRLLCLEAGAGLLFTNGQLERNTGFLRKYLLHRLYPSHLAMSLQIEDQSNPTASVSNNNTPVKAAPAQTSAQPLIFVPAGFDTANLIEISTREKATEKRSLQYHLQLYQQSQLQSPQNSLLGTPLPSLSTASTVSSVDSDLQELESEQEWLTSLQRFLSQVVDASPAASSLATSSSTGNLSSLVGSSSSSSTTSGLTGAAAATRKASVGNLSGAAAGAGIASGSAGGAVGAGAEGSTATTKLRSAVTRKPSMLPPAANSNQNAKDFFSSLMGDKK